MIRALESVQRTVVPATRTARGRMMPLVYGHEIANLTAYDSRPRGATRLLKRSSEAEFCVA
jgi:hypothetical protein